MEGMEVDLVLSDKLSADVMDDIEAEFRGWGLTPTVRLLPPRRGAQFDLLVLATLPLASFLNTLASKFAEDAFQSLRNLIQRVLPGRTTATGTAHVLVLQDEQSGTRITLEPDLPIEGYHALLTSDLAASPGATLRYDRARHAWSSG
ncbi:hypothetical protein [Streptomyces sclerotialus]|uniref:hypothetical protein n=1 Tax=Streptomyces sclerotialus TaxID=1957 RepID=UPI000690D703